MIASLSVTRVRIPFRAPFATAARTWTARDLWVLRLEHDDGTTGWGEVVPDEDADAPALERLLASVAAVPGPLRLPGPDDLVEGGPVVRAFHAAITGALAGPGYPRALEPGGSGVGVNAVIAGSSPDEVAAAAAAAAARGFRTLKLKAGPGDTTAALVDRVRAARDAVGDSTVLRLDVNASWDLESAVDRLRRLEAFGLQYVEQPLAAAALADAAALRRRIGVPVAADEAVVSSAAARDVLEAGAADVLVVKPARVGGITVVAAIEAMATQLGVPVVVSSSFESGIGLVSAYVCARWVAEFSDVPGWPAAERDHGLATAALLEHDLLREPLRVEGGRLRLPYASPVAVDEVAVARYRVAPA